ncbi:MFS transporter [Nocardioides sp. SOB77]|uniref:MFS transporter n=1 Tax=Nocardioides oceani TaxID=3058369 RepID=A0ABT8FL23_9ACTN|nr:MFS transporter [Nocardioides oceani]MDN4175378.1 MFS transporter [Nocardioides oceani]
MLLSPLALTLASARSVGANRRLLLVQLALLASLVGDAAYATAVTVWAYAEGGATAVGVFTAVRLTAAAVVAPLGAALADRHERRTTLLVANGARAVLVALGTACLVLDLTGAVYLLAVLAGVLAAPFRTAQRAWMPALSETPGQLTAANATSSTSESLAVFVGPALGAAVLVVADTATAFVLTGVLFVVSVLLVLAVRTAGAPPPGRPVPIADRDTGPAPAASGVAAGVGAGVAAELTAGFRTLAVDRDLRSVTAQVCAQTFVGGAAKVFLVVLAVEVMGSGPSGVGLLDAVIGVGAVLGGLLALARAERQRLARDLNVGVLLWAAPLLLVVAWPHPVAVVAALVVLGVANPLVDVNLDTIVQRMTAETRLARVFGALDSCYIATSALGSFVMPVLLGHLDLRWALAAVAAPVLVVAVVSARRMARLDVRLAGLGSPELLHLLRGVPLLAPISPPVLEQLARGLARLAVPAGAVVVAEGDAGDAFYVVESGEVEVTQGGIVLRRQGVGDFFGEIALLHDVPRTATVTTRTDVRLQVLDRRAFLDALSGRSLTAAHDIAAARLATRG